jgi:RNA processing factor Prp31
MIFSYDKNVDSWYSLKYDEIEGIKNNEKYFEENP